MMIFISVNIGSVHDICFLAETVKKLNKSTITKKFKCLIYNIMQNYLRKENIKDEIKFCPRLQLIFEGFQGRCQFCRSF